MSRRRTDTVSKTIRMPQDLVEYVESQKGRNFSDKLVSLLVETCQGESERKRMLDLYDEKIAEKRVKLDELNHQIYKASNVLRGMAGVLSYAEGESE